MLIYLKELRREGASDPPIEFDIAIESESIKVVTDEDECFAWKWPACRISLDDGREFVVASSVEGVVLAARGMDAISLRLLGDRHAGTTSGQA